MSRLQRGINTGDKMMEPKDEVAFIRWWISKEIKKREKSGVVFGLSGGVDSATIAMLCKGISSLAMIMPCFSDPEDEKDAIQFAHQNFILYSVINLDSAFEALVRKLAPNKKIVPSKKEFANMKSRLRMICLYFEANQLDFLVLGTGNQSERAVGYFTKYGDGGVDLLPIGHLLKEDVYEIAKYLKVPKKILTKKPSAGLWVGQTDEKELGFTYQEIGEFLHGKKTKHYEKIKDQIQANFHKNETPQIPKERDRITWRETECI